MIQLDHKCVVAAVNTTEYIRHGTEVRIKASSVQGRGVGRVAKRTTIRDGVGDVLCARSYVLVDEVRQCATDAAKIAGRNHRAPADVAFHTQIDFVNRRSLEVRIEVNDIRLGAAGSCGSGTKNIRELR